MPMMYRKQPIGTCAYMGGVWVTSELFTWSWSQMVQYNTEYLVHPNEYIHYDRATNSIHEFARNSLVKNMLGDWLLMFDCDHQFEPDILGRMLYTMNLAKIDVLVGLYHYRVPPYKPVIFRWKEDSIVEGGYEPLVQWDPRVKLLQIDSAGAGCLLVRKSVYERIQEELDEEPFSIISPYGEDHSFFRRLKQLDIPAYCSPQIQCKHLITKPIGWEDFDQSGLILSEEFIMKGLK